MSELTNEQKIEVLKQKIFQLDVTLYGLQADYEVGKLLSEPELMESTKKQMSVFQKRKTAFTQLLEALQKEEIPE